MLNIHMINSNSRGTHIQCVVFRTSGLGLKAHVGVLRRLQLMTQWWENSFSLQNWQTQMRRYMRRFTHRLIVSWSSVLLLFWWSRSFPEREEEINVNTNWLWIFLTVQTQSLLHLLINSPKNTSRITDVKTTAAVIPTVTLIRDELLSSAEQTRGRRTVTLYIQTMISLRSTEMILTFNRDWNRCWSLRSILILSLTIVASTVTGVKAGDDETLSRSNSWALILLKPAEVQSRRVWVTAAAQSHWISLHYFTRRTDGHRDALWRI